MIHNIKTYCGDHGQPVPETIAEFTAAILRNLARHYRETLEVLEQLRGTRYEVIHIVGGGSKNEWLCELTGLETGRTIVAGPVEATALGNLMIQSGRLSR